MISAQELRIGNWLSFKGMWNGQIENVDSVITIKGNKGVFLLETFKGIPITPEILEKFGFKFDGVIWTMKDVAFYLMPGNAGFYCSYVHNPLQYIHQLQNLYFALTGEELKLIEDATV